LGSFVFLVKEKKGSKRNLFIEGEGRFYRGLIV